MKLTSYTTEQLEAELNRRKTEWPQGGHYWFMSSAGANKFQWHGDSSDVFSLERGLIFRTREEAEAADRKRIAIAKLQKLSGDQSWVDWDDREQDKFYMIYNTYTKRWNVVVSNWMQSWFFGYFKTTQDCRAAIAEMGEMMDWIRGA